MVGGLLLVGGTMGDWVVVEEVRNVGGLPVGETHATSGTSFTAAAIPLGVVTVLVAPFLAWRRARNVCAVALLVLAAAAAVHVGAGTAVAARAPGRLGGGPMLAGAGAVCVAASGILALRGKARKPAEASRYTLEGAEDREWELAAEDHETPGEGGAASATGGRGTG